MSEGQSSYKCLISPYLMMFYPGLLPEEDLRSVKIANSRVLFIRGYFLRDAMIVSLVNCGTSVFAGFVIYSILGYRQHLKIGDVKNVSLNLPFKNYPS